MPFQVLLQLLNVRIDKLERTGNRCSAPLKSRDGLATGPPMLLYYIPGHCSEAYVKMLCVKVCTAVDNSSGCQLVQEDDFKREIGQETPVPPRPQ